MKKNYYNCIYMYINVINNRKYVGQAKDFNRRHKQHIRKSSNKTLIDKAFNKYGEENFKIIILKENLCSQCLLNLYEYYYIEKYNCLSKENYNIASGGHNGNPFEGKTEDEMEIIKQKMRELNIGKTLSNETKAKIGNASMGRKHTEESKRKISESQKGKIFSDESRQKMSEKRKGKHKGKDNYNAKKVYQYNLDGNLIKIWDCAKQASEELNINQNCISKCCHNKIKTAGGFIWSLCEMNLK